ncbi:DNA-binding domain-containing protein [Parvibium lacunae]|uniref:Putative DNA-binding domain-containing protein n=1 Tax=Parvibium lacunae TaxID=1888893 RepID=A0A368L2P0_9BURK|nr:DNA-binding domain-containing protein [Parvibium lacunae]RCS57378.1 hypothetical protein DU000_07895 [Parvibium lacunae]
MSILSLTALQHTFTAGLRQRSAEAALYPCLVGSAEQVSERLAIYRGNVLANLESAMRNTYPICAALVGDEFFAGLTRAYWQAHPSQSGDLGEFGEQLAAFLETFTPAQDLPYLADIARLEWAQHLAYRAADHTPLDLTQLASLAPDSLTALRARFQPACQLLAPTYNIYPIWEAHQPDYTGDWAIDWQAPAEPLIIYRENWVVRIAPLDRPSFVFLQTWQHHTLGDALAQATAAASINGLTFDLNDTLIKWVSLEVITHITT